MAWARAAATVAPMSTPNWSANNPTSVNDACCAPSTWSQRFHPVIWSQSRCQFGSSARRHGASGGCLPRNRNGRDSPGSGIGTSCLPSMSIPALIRASATRAAVALAAARGVAAHGDPRRVDQSAPRHAGCRRSARPARTTRPSPGPAPASARTPRRGAPRTRRTRRSGRRESSCRVLVRVTDDRDDVAVARQVLGQRGERGARLGVARRQHDQRQAVATGRPGVRHGVGRIVLSMSGGTSRPLSRRAAPPTPPGSCTASSAPWSRSSGRRPRPSAPGRAPSAPTGRAARCPSGTATCCPPACHRSAPAGTASRSGRW